MIRATLSRGQHDRPDISVAAASRRTVCAETRGRVTAGAAFTLIELLVVVGLIVLIVGGFAVALSGRSGEGAALANAQSIVAGLVHTARAQAALYQTKARIVVYGQMPTSGDASKYLRSLVVLREDPLDSGRYVAVGDSVTLPPPICVVPPSPVPTNHLGLPTGQSWNNNVSTGPVSTLGVLNGFSYTGQPTGAGRPTVQQFFGAQGQSGRVLYLEFLADGTVPTPAGVPAGSPIKIAVATAVLGGNVLPRFNNAYGVRGLFIRKTGAVSFVNDATAF